MTDRCKYLITRSRWTLLGHVIQGEECWHFGSPCRDPESCYKYRRTWTE